MEKRTVGRSFFSGVMILTVANLMVKVIGLLYKIPLTNMLGDEGMGYFNTAYQIYSWLYMFSTAGLPVAMSMMISRFNAEGKQAEKRRLLLLTLCVFLAIGLTGSIIMMLLCRQLAGFIAADLSYLCILAISPALFFVCISSTLRGYFQGHSNMLPTAISEILESVGKAALGIFLGGYALKQGLPIYQVAAYSIIGVSAGVAAGAIFLALAKLTGKRDAGNNAEKADTIQTESVESGKSLLKTLFTIAIPVMISASLLSASSMIDTLVIIRRLIKTGVAESAAIAMYGNYTSYCVTLFNLPPVLIYPIVNSLIPIVSSAKAVGDEKKAERIMTVALRLSAVIALPCAFGLATLSEPILKLIFENAASAEMAAPLLSTLAPSIFLIGVMAVSNGILQACGMQKYTLISMPAGAAVKAILAYLLPSLTIGGAQLRMYAAPISTFAFYLTVTAINFFFIVRYTSLRISVAKIYLRPFIASVICAVCAAGGFILLKDVAGAKLSTLIAISVAAVIYAITLLLIGAISREELEMLPFGKKLTPILTALKLIK